MSSVRHAHAVTPEQHSCPLRPDGRSIAIYVADFPLGTDARCCEQLLGRLAADGDLDVLDGAVVEWPPDAPTPVRHPLRNVPRLAALTEAAWDAALQPNGDRLLHPELTAAATALVRGHSAVIAICAACMNDQVQQELRQTGANVDRFMISTEMYTKFRRDHRPAREQPDP